VTAEVLTALGTLLTALGVAFAGVQLILNRRQARSQFEDDLTSVYRELVALLPVDAFFDETIASNIVSEHLSVFYRYFDLCNEQVFLHAKGRVSEETWHEWRSGIIANMRRPAFEAAWSEIEPHISGDFQELRELTKLDRL
jgi:hypothetical protein